MSDKYLTKNVKEGTQVQDEQRATAEKRKEALKSLIRRTVEESTEFLHKLKCGAEVRAARYEDDDRETIGITVIKTSGTVINRKDVKKSKFFGGSSTVLDFLMDLPIDVEREEVTIVWNELKRKFKSLQTVRTDSMNFWDVYNELCKYSDAHKNDEFIEVKDGYYSIKATIFKEIVTECNYKPLQFKKELKDLKLLKINSDRPYDCNKVDSNGKAYKAIVFKDILAEGGEE